ncbi:MAG: carboxypeptidase regulatory-like domain-containing protein, partial [Pyrinomonadaceae bacterium]
TTSEIIGTVTDAQGNGVAGVNIEATHVPSGTVYTSVSNDAGRYAIPGMRVGGPYTVKATQAGFKEQTRENLQLSLGNASSVNFTLSAAINEVVTVTNDEIFSEARTGASTNVGNEVVSTLPTISRRLNDFAKLSPHYGGGPFGGSVAGQDNRLNNITVDGSYFNNSFGLSGQPGDRSGVSPIALDSIEEFQINVAPYDVRQGNFTGAGINTVTKSGTNLYHGSGYYNWNNQQFIGTETGNLIFNRGRSKYKLWGLTAGGPLPFFNFGENNGPAFISGRDKLFFFVSYEQEETSSPAHNFTACPGATGSAGCGVGSVSRVSGADLDALSSYLSSRYGYVTGPYQGYNFTTPGKKFLLRNDYNINAKNRLTLRYLMLDSSTDRPISTSNSGNTAGFGRGSQGTRYLSYANSNYKILENIDSFVGEWTTSPRANMANSLIIGYTTQDESRPQLTKLFPLVDIHDGTAATSTSPNLSANTALLSFGFEPFTPLNTLKYDSLQIQDNFSYYRGSHTLQAGISFEKYHSLNIFFPSSQSIYSYRSLADFYADSNAFLAGVPSPVSPVRFNVRFSNQPGLAEPVQPLDVKYIGAYGQDQWRVRDNFTLTYGLRIEVPFFGDTGFKNSLVDTLTFRGGEKLNTFDLPNANIVWSPRIGFNWNPFDSGKLQIRGGSGSFSARPPYVWISNQIGNNGVLTSLISATQANNVAPLLSQRFNPNPDAYKPAIVTGAPIAGAQDLNFTVPGYKFPQIWRSSIAADYKIWFGLVAGTEFIYSKEINGTAYRNSNLAAPDIKLVGADTRPRWSTTAARTVNTSVVQAITLFNQSIGKAWNMAFTLEKPTSRGFYAKGGYAYGVSKNAVDAGSTAGTSFSGNNVVGDPNIPELGFSSAYMGHRVFASASYHFEYFKFGGTTISAFWESQNQSNGSFRTSNDLNNDSYSNDLIYIQRDPSETIFLTSGGFTPAQQSAAWEAFIAQDSYLSKHRGEYAVRNARLFPIKHNLDLSISQEIYANFFKARHRFQIRADILNFGNLLNKNWGTGVQAATNAFTPLAFSSLDGSGRPQYTLNLPSTGVLPKTTFVPRSTSISDVYRIQIGLKYSF